MSDQINGRSGPRRARKPRVRKPRARKPRRANRHSEVSPLGRLLAFIVGCVFVLGGLACVAEAVANLDDMKKAPKVVYREREMGEPRRDVGDDGGYSLSGGFGVGVQALFGMLFVGVGTGVAAPQVTGGFGPRNRNILRGIAAILALAWHGVGIGTCWCYCRLAPAIDVWPFLMVMAYELLGLIPLGLAIPEGDRSRRLRSAVWYAMGGGFLGGFAGAAIGGVVGGMAMLLSYTLGDYVVGTTWWLYASIGGGLATGVVFALRRLTGWEISSGDDKSKRKTKPSGEVPYGIDKRPMPTGDDLETLLPSQVGPFGRVELRPLGDLDPSITYATYLAGEAEVFVELGTCGSSGAAQGGIETAKSEVTPDGDRIIQAWSIGTEPSFFKSTNPRLGAFIAWTRGGYYFSTHAKGGEAALDAFMNEFPY